MVPRELADLIPIDAHEGIVSVMDELVIRFPYAREDVSFWMWAISVWSTRQIVDIQRRIEPPPYEGG